MRIKLFILLQLLPVLLFAQGQNNIWYFGNNAGITFNTSPPTALTDGQLVTGEGCAAICDHAGNLLFYTDGNTVYNRNHVVMVNGSGLFGQYSSTQSAIIVPLPGSMTVYYIFTLDAFANAHGVCYSIVDMTLDGGLGAVTTKNTQILTPASEKITAIKHANNQDFWIVIHGWNDNKFYSYSFTSSGLNLTPIITPIGSIHTGGGGPNNANNAIGYMKVNAAGNTIALAVTMLYFYELFQFDKITGVLSNMISLGNPDNATNKYPYALEFSPDNHYLYIKDFYSLNVYQYDMTVYNQSSVINSKTFVGTVSGNPIYFNGGMQLGPDNKIYIVKFDSDSLAIINNPNNPAATCGLVDNAISLNGRNGQLGLPCLVNTSFFNNEVIIPTEDTSEIWFPNTFTPNGDGINDVFKAEGLNIFDFHIIIFNRWGQQIFESFSIYDGWDGTFKGKKSPEGIYVWMADYLLYRNHTKVKEHARGKILLVR